MSDNEYNMNLDNIEFDFHENKVEYQLPEDMDKAYAQYIEIPIVREFVSTEIRNKFAFENREPREIVTGYEVRGFLWEHAGEEYTIDLEDYGISG